MKKIYSRSCFGYTFLCDMNALGYVFDCMCVRLCVYVFVTFPIPFLFGINSTDIETKNNKKQYNYILYKQIYLNQDNIIFVIFFFNFFTILIQFMLLKVRLITN